MLNPPPAPLTGYARIWRTVVGVSTALWLASCANIFKSPAPSLPPSAPPSEPTPAPTPTPAPVSPPAAVPKVSQATTAKDYRRDAAQHLYSQNQHRIYEGQLPPQLYAVGVMQVELNYKGQIRKLHWVRAPQHAPEVMAEIERTIRAAEPFPIPKLLGGHAYTDTWLWDKSGRFQLDTLTEGQLSQR